MDFIQRMKRALQRGRSATLPPDSEDAVYVLLPFVMQNQVRAVSDLLVNSTFDINYQFGRARRTLLHSAANTGAADCVAFLLKRNASVNLRDKIGITALHLAARNGHKKCVHRLVEAGADISIHDNEGLTALHWLACNGRTELLVGILQRGEFVDVTDAHGHTALHVACQNGHYRCVVQLLENKADIHKTSKSGGTPLHFACKHGQLKCLKLLLKRGAKVVSDNNGTSPFQLCVQGKYYECVEAMLINYPDQVDHVIKLVFDEKIPEKNILSLLEYLCNSDTYLLVSIVTTLANRAASAGMELLSVSSNYQDLMPSFLRGIRALCTLYSYYTNTARTELSHSLLSHSVPTSPSGRDNTLSPVPNVRRTGSFGSLLDSPSRNRGRSILRFSGHRRSQSQSSPPNSNHSPSQDLSSPPHRTHSGPQTQTSTISDPFDNMEMVWSSLESWFDLLMNEVEKIQKEEQGLTVTQLSHQSVEPDTKQNLVPNLATSSPGSDIPSPKPPTVVFPPCDSPPQKKRLSLVQTSQLAAAIVNSAPPQRRTVYLKTSTSFDETPMSSFCDRVLKRRSWHMERVAARYLTTIGDSQPSFDRSLSSDSVVERLTDHLGARRVTSPLLEIHEAPSEAAGGDGDRDKSWNPDIVGVYADRLCAVTHAFGLCCSTVQKASGCPGALPRFIQFIDKYEPVLKVLLARNPQLIFAHFHFLLENTQLLMRFMHIVHAQPFADRKKWFYENLYGGKPPSNELTLAAETNSILVDRDDIFTTSCTKLAEAPVESLKDNLTIQFLGEAGMGSGVRREWFDSLSKEVLNPDYALFTQSADGATFQPNSHSDVNPDHLSYFKFAGRMMALAIFHQHLLNVYFTRSFYKHILGIPLSYRDVESIDPEYASNLQWLLDHEIDSLGLELTFSVETDVFGTTEMIELKPRGASTTVTNKNKQEYVQLVTEMRMTQAIGPQIRSFLDGFYEVIPPTLLALFDEYELELLLSGLPDIDVDDWQKSSEYSSGYDEETPVIKWFWEIVHEFDANRLAILLQFVTGSSRVPLGGFAHLVGATGLTKFTISRVEYSPNKLPTASTCFNLLKLPEYPSKEILKERLHVALTCGSGLIDIT